MVESVDILDELVKQIRNKEIAGGWLKLKITDDGRIVEINFNKKLKLELKNCK